MGYESDSDTNCNWCTQYSHQSISTGSSDYPNYSIVEIGQNTEKSPGDLRFVVTQILMKNQANTGVKNSQREIIIIIIIMMIMKRSYAGKNHKIKHRNHWLEMPGLQFIICS